MGYEDGAGERESGAAVQSRDPNSESAGTQNVSNAKMRVAFYARYSTDGQKETSIDDQLMQCEAVTRRLAIGHGKPLVFTDEAMSGRAKGTAKRDQYQKMRAAVRAGQVDVLVCDQQCRLARSARESLDFLDELKQHGVWLLTADGFDSRHPTAQLLYGIRSVFAEFFIEETQHRVRRGMVGSFSRGGMVTYMPYGYRVDPLKTAEVGECQWELDPAAAEVVREMFRLRKNGMSLNQIAAVLNGRGVAPPRPGDEPQGKYWRAMAIWRLLQNPLYKGIYTVNFGPDQSGKPQVGQRLMAELALVSAQEWDACHAQGKGSRPAVRRAGAGPVRAGKRARYGGGRHPLAGVFACGTCGVPLSCHHAKGEGGTMHCVQCEQATAVGVPGRKPLHVSVKGVRLMLRWLLERIVRGEALLRYRELLRQRLCGGQDLELATARQELDRAQRAQARLGRLLPQIAADDPVLEQQYLKTREEVLLLNRRVEEAERGVRQQNGEAIRKQLEVDVGSVLDSFLDDRQDPARTRAVLQRIFPGLVLRSKTDRYTAIFEVHVRPGAMLAEAAGTIDLLDGNEVLWVCLKTSGSKHPVWTVEEIDSPDEVYGGEAAAVVA